MQKCWTCANAYGGCSWADVDPKTDKVKFQPVDGWVAEPVFRSTDGRRIIESYEIKECPKYVPDGINRLSVEDQVIVMHENGIPLRQIAVHTGIMSENRLRKIIEGEYL